MPGFVLGGAGRLKWEQLRSYPGRGKIFLPSGIYNLKPGFPHGSSLRVNRGMVPIETETREWIHFCNKGKKTPKCNRLAAGYWGRQ